MAHPSGVMYIEAKTKDEAIDMVSDAVDFDIDQQRMSDVTDIVNFDAVEVSEEEYSKNE